MNLKRDDLADLRQTLENEKAEALAKVNMARGALQLLDHLLSEMAIETDNNDGGFDSVAGPVTDYEARVIGANGDGDGNSRRREDSGAIQTGQD